MRRPWLISVAASILPIVLIVLAVAGQQSLVAGVVGRLGVGGDRSIEAATSLTYTVSLAGLQRDWPTVATPTVTPTPSVTITDTAVPTITLELSDIGVASGGNLTATWQIWGPAEPAEQYALLLRAREPGDLYAPGGPLMQLGMAPATGSQYYLTPDLGWTLTETVYLTPSVSSSVAITLPSALQGEWRFEALLQQVSSGEVAAVAGQAFLASDQPAMLLKLSRPIANTGDRVRADLVTAAGPYPQLVRIVAYLSKPDGSQVSLPTLTPDLRLAYTGSSYNGRLVLLDQDLSAFGAGQYQIQARMAYTYNNALMSMAVADLSICDTPGVVTGTVYAASGQPLGGGTPRFTEVDAFDVDDGSVTGSAAIDASGVYSMTLLPGRYQLSLRVLDSAGLHSSRDAQLLKIGCSGIAVTRAITASAPMALTAAPLAARSVGSTGGPMTVFAGGGDEIPKPDAFAAYTNQGVAKDVASASFDLFLTIATRNTLQLVDLTTPAAVQAALFPASVRQALGDDTVDVTELAGALNKRFTIALKFEKTQSIGKVTVTVVDTLHANQLYAREQLVSGSADTAWLDAAEALADALGPNLYRLLDGARDRPIKPRLTLTVVPSSVQPGGAVTVTATLKDADGTPAGGKTVSLVHQNPAGRETINGTTDSSGIYVAHIAVGDSAGVGLLNGYFMGRDNQVANPARGEYRITGPADLSLTSTKVRLRKDETAPVCATLEHNDLPTAGARITLTSRLGWLDYDRVTTDANGQSCVNYTAGSSSGIDIVGAVGAPPTTTVAAPVASLPFVLDSDVRTYFNPQTATIVNSAIQSIIVYVYSGLSSHLPAVPLEFSLTGEGALSATSGQTDQDGMATVYYQAPPSGEGSTVLSAVAIVEGARYTSTATISYRSPSCAVSSSVPRCYNVTPLVNNCTDGCTRFDPVRLASDGRVFGVRRSYSAGTDTYYAAVWRNGTITDLSVLSTLGGGSYISEVADINDSGIAVGTIMTPTAYPETPFGIKWVGGTAYRLNVWWTGALGVNNAGDVVGWVGSQYMAWPDLWPGTHIAGADRIITDTRITGNDYMDQGYATAINNSGTIAAQLVFTMPIAGYQAATWRDGQITQIGTLGGPTSWPYRINDTGYVVGYSDTADGKQRGFFWNGTTLTDIGAHPSGNGYSDARSVNSSGQVVGSSGNAPFLWSNGTMYDLSKAVDFADLMYVNYTYASSINDAGQILIPNGGYSVLLTPR